MAFIYKITNMLNGKSYIGKTSRTIQERFKEHIGEIKNNDNHRPLYNAFRKYGIENFKLELIEVLKNDEEASEREIYWIKHYNTFYEGYNATAGGDGTRIRNYEEIKNKYLELKSITKTSEYFGYKKATVRNALNEYGLLNTKDNYNEDCEKTNKPKKIKRIDKFGNEEIYESITQASKQFEDRRNSTVQKAISKAIHGRTKTAYGYRWEVTI